VVYSVGGESRQDNSALHPAWPKISRCAQQVKRGGKGQSLSSRNDGVARPVRSLTGLLQLPTLGGIRRLTDATDSSHNCGWLHKCSRCGLRAEVEQGPHKSSPSRPSIVRHRRANVSPTSRPSNPPPAMSEPVQTAKPEILIVAGSVLGDETAALAACPERACILQNDAPVFAAPTVDRCAKFRFRYGRGGHTTRHRLHLPSRRSFPQMIILPQVIARPLMG
jgi:hypothetical protein